MRNEKSGKQNSKRRKRRNEMNTITNKRSIRLLCAAVTAALLFAGWAPAPSVRDAQNGGAPADYAYAADAPLTRIWNKTIKEDVLLVKLGKSGEVVWKKALSGSDYDCVYNMTALNDGGFAIIGITDSTDYDFSGLTAGKYIAKYDRYGVCKWIKTMSGVNFEGEYGGVTEDAAGNLLVAGGADSSAGLPNKGGDDFFLAKYDKNGGLKWRKTYGGSGWDSLKSVMVTKSGNIVAVGSSKSNDGDVPPGDKNIEDAVIMQLDTDGNIKDIKLWGKIHQWEDATTRDVFYDVVQLTGGRYAAVGISHYYDAFGSGYTDAEVVCYAGEVIADSESGATSTDFSDAGAKLTVTAPTWTGKTVKVSYKGKTTASCTIKKLKKGKTYQVRVVTYKKIKSGASKGTYKSLPTAVKSKKVTK
jgi:hypothetical protein